MAGERRAPAPRAPGPSRPRAAAGPLAAAALAGAAALLGAAAVLGGPPAQGGQAGEAPVPAAAPVRTEPSLFGADVAGPVPPPPAVPDAIPGPGEVRLAPATPAPAPAVPAPVRVAVDGTPIDMPVVPVGVRDDGSMNLPDNHVELGWYRHGPAPGAAEGAAVVAGHVDTLTEVTPMARLRDVAPGTEVTVERADGSVLRYRTEAVVHVHKRSLADADLFRRTGQPVLYLVTCGGQWLEEIGDYEDNVVLRAVPAE